MTRIRFRRGTAAQWTSANPVLTSGEPGFETDTGKFKIGDGSTAWNSLAYESSGGSGDVATDTIWDVKGDLVVASGSDAADNLGVGSDGDVLTAASGETLGVKWDAPAAGSGGGLLAVKADTTGGNQSTTSSSLSDIDATNAAVTFTAPASGNVLVRITASGNTANAIVNSFLGVREGSTNVAGPFFFLDTGNLGGGADMLGTVVFYITGLSAGSHTYKAAFAINSGQTLTVRGSSTAPLTIEVWAAP